MWIEQFTVRGVGSSKNEKTYIFEPGCTVIATENGTGADLTALMFETLLGSGNASFVALDQASSAEVRFRVGEDTYTVRRAFSDGDISLSKEPGEVLFEGSGTGSDGEAGYRERLSKILDLNEDIWSRSSGLSRLGQLKRELKSKEGLLNHAEQIMMDRDEILQNTIRFEHLTRERQQLENSLVELKEERDRTRKYVESQEQAKARLQREYPGFLHSSTDLQAEIQAWIDSAHRFQSLNRDLDRVRRAIQRLSPIRTIQNGGIAGILLGVLAWIICQGSGAPRLGLMLFPFFSAIGFGMVWYMDRAAQRVRISHQEEEKRIEEERDAADRVHAETRERLGTLSEYETPEELRDAFRGYMELQERLERAVVVSATYRSLSEVQNDYEGVFGELQVLDTQTRHLVAQARYLSGMDAKPQVLLHKIAKSRREGAEAKAHLDQLTPQVEKLREELKTVQDDADSGEPVSPDSVVERIRGSLDGDLAQNPPLVLDECFQGWDESKLELARNAIKDLVASGGQAILLTADTRVAAWADSVIHLDPHQNGDAGLEAA
jgi:hypothetical protein